VPRPLIEPYCARLPLGPHHKLARAQAKPDLPVRRRAEAEIPHGRDEGPLRQVGLETHLPPPPLHHPESPLPLLLLPVPDPLDEQYLQEVRALDRRLGHPAGHHHLCHQSSTSKSTHRCSSIRSATDSGEDSARSDARRSSFE